jgi:hypothetical protein
LPLVTETVQRPAHDPAVPDILAPSAQLLGELRESGALETLGGALRLSRRGGYTGVPLISFGLTYLAACTPLGLRPFWETHKRPLKRVAAVAGCTAFPSSGSVSRALVKVDSKTADGFADVALSTEANPQLVQVLSHPSVVHRDSRGDPLHVLDIDPTVQAYRLRDLIEGDDYPEPERQAPGVPGYTGHHRGEVRIRHLAVCHAGAGVWLSYRVSDDNPRLSTFFPSVLVPALDVMRSAGIQPSQILVRGDAEFGSAGVARAIVELGVQLLVRIGRYRLLDRPEVLERLQRADWEEVPSGAVRVREAADLGTVMLHPSDKSADAGTPGIALRVVVARRKVDSNEVTYGTLRDGYQYELFATTLSAEAWSAADIVALYGGRSAIENRFAQEDRELELGRTFSYRAPGQAVFTALGLFLWNYWTTTGFLEAPAADAVPKPIPRELRPIEAAGGAEQPVHERATPDSADAAPEPVEPAEPVRKDPSPPPDPPASPVPADPMDPYPGVPAEERASLVTILRSAYGDLLQLPGWSIESAGFLRCPNNKRLFPFCLAKTGPGRPKPQAIVRSDVGACDGCPLRPECFASNRPNVYKQIGRAISIDDAAFLASFLDRHPPGRRSRPLAQGARSPRATPKPAQRPTVPIVSPPSTGAVGPWRCANPTFQAAAARQRARSRHANARVEILINRRRRPAPHPTDLGRTRRTWEQREARWRLDATVTLIRYVPRQPPKRRRG